ncbi:MAG: 2-phosphosulfolactate phosphatase [Trueperaceae bacterium]|nr:2-phosphosulfolactate phosphatase [Trueperaceae bacterium]
MHVRVDLVPHPPYKDTVVLIDVLRTSTVAPILFENGLERLHIATKLRLAREFAKETDALLMGERDGLPPEGFNYGNSPSELASLNLSGHAVLVSENAPTVLPELEGAKHLLLGSLYNADAVVKRALELAKDNIYLVGCGLWGQEDLDDAIAAGYMATRFKELLPDVKLSGAARLSMSLVRAFPDPLKAIWYSSAGYFIKKLGAEDDLVLASLVSQSDQVPELESVVIDEHGSMYTFYSPTVPSTS